MPHLIREVVRIPSVQDHVSLDVWFYRLSHPASPPYPVVILGHGLTLIKDAGLAAFGEHCAEDAGYAALILDYRGFGASDGKPRYLLDTNNQLQDYKSVLKWARDRPDTFRADKIVVLGYSMSGLYVADLAMNDTGIAGAIVQCPLFDGYQTHMAFGFRGPLLFWALVDTVKGMLGLSPAYIVAVGKPGSSAYVATLSAYTGFSSLYSRVNMTVSETPNLITPRLLLDVMRRRPGLRLKTAKCPMLVIAAEEDDIIGLKMTEGIVEAAEGKLELCALPGGHFNLMDSEDPTFKLNMKAQVEFLRRLL
ncbi:alpha/beta-hydrolase [Ramaria rubella]|nr:alpha/beta-hydrolase [Ramaria rubella]